MSKVALTTHNGGLEGAIETYKANPTPNLSSSNDAADRGNPRRWSASPSLRRGDPPDRARPVNDVVLYRELIRSGVSGPSFCRPRPSDRVGDYRLFAAEGAAPIGRTIGFISAKGGSGASTVAHNVAWAISQNLRRCADLDMDFAFGTAGLNFVRPAYGIADAIGASQKMDQTLLDRLSSKVPTM